MKLKDFGKISITTKFPTNNDQTSYVDLLAEEFINSDLSTNIGAIL